MKKNKHESPWGPAFNNKPYLQMPRGAIGKIVKCGFSVTDAVVLSELIGFSYKGTNKVSVSASSLGECCGLTRQTAARALSKAIKMKLIIVTKEYSVDKGTARQYDIRPFLEKLQSDYLFKEQEPATPESEEIIENKNPNRFGSAIYDPPPTYGPEDDIPDDATVGWKFCQECRGQRPREHDCEVAA